MLITGLHGETYKGLVGNAGCAFRNFGDLSTMKATDLPTALDLARKDPKKMMGATDGAFKITDETATRKAKLDDVGDNNIKGTTIVTSKNVHAAFTLKEMTVENIAMALGNAEILPTVDGRTEIKPRYNITEESYIDDITHFAEFADGSGYFVTQLLNSLNVKGFDFATESLGEAALAIDMVAHMEDTYSDDLPVKYYKFDRVEPTKATPAKAMPIGG